MTPPDALDRATVAIAAVRAAPQSRKKAMLAALLLDAAIDAAFAANGEGDLLAYRAALVARRPSLRPIIDLAALAEVTLVIEPVEVAIGDYPALGVEDFMVSLYNGRSVPRVLIASPDGSCLDVHEALAAALAALADEARVA